MSAYGFHNPPKRRRLYSSEAARPSGAVRPSSAARSSDTVPSYINFILNSTRGPDGFSYIETTARALPPAQWTSYGSESLKRYPLRPDPDDGPPPHTLSFHARKALTEHSDHLTPEIVRCVDWRFASRMWEDLVETGRDSVRAWLVFTTAYPRPWLRSTNVPAERPIAELQAILPSDFPGHTYLDFRGAKGVIQSDLANMLDLPGLRVLKVAGAVDDSVVRIWARRGERAKGLRELHIVDCPGFTSHSLEYLGMLPRLTVLRLVRCDMGSGSVWSEFARLGRWSVCREGPPEEMVNDEDEKPKLTLNWGGVGIGSISEPWHGSRILTFVRREGAAAAMGTKKAGEAVQRPATPATVRKERMKDMGGLLSEFMAKGPPRRRKR